MAIFEVELHQDVIKTFEADHFNRSGDSFYFYDRENNLVGSIVSSPGMSVTKTGHNGPERRSS